MLGCRHIVVLQNPFDHLADEDVEAQCMGQPNTGKLQL
jgi:hypothetical protein